MKAILFEGLKVRECGDGAEAHTWEGQDGPVRAGLSMSAASRGRPILRGDLGRRPARLEGGGGEVGCDGAVEVPPSVGGGPGARAGTSAVGGVRALAMG